MGGFKPRSRRILLSEYIVDIYPNKTPISLSNPVIELGGFLQRDFVDFILELLERSVAYEYTYFILLKLMKKAGEVFGQDVWESSTKVCLIPSSCSYHIQPLKL
jgi:hypothetical protein